MQKTMANVGHQRFTKSVLYSPIPYCKIIRDFPLSIVLMLINVKMLVMTKKKLNLSDSDD